MQSQIAVNLTPTSVVQGNASVGLEMPVFAGIFSLFADAARCVREYILGVAAFRRCR